MIIFRNNLFYTALMNTLINKTYKFCLELSTWPHLPQSVDSTGISGMCISTGDTHITSDMCIIGILLVICVKEYTYHRGTHVSTYFLPVSPFKLLAEETSEVSQFCILNIKAKRSDLLSFIGSCSIFFFHLFHPVVRL